MKKADKKASWTRLTETDYEHIKYLLGLGISGKQVAEVLMRGASTVSYVKRSTSFKDYRDIVAAVREERDGFTPIIQQESTVVKIDLSLDQWNLINFLRTQEWFRSWLNQEFGIRQGE